MKLDWCWKSDEEGMYVVPNVIISIRIDRQFFVSDSPE